MPDSKPEAEKAPPPETDSAEAEIAKDTTAPVSQEPLQDTSKSLADVEETEIEPGHPAKEEPSESRKATAETSQPVPEAAPDPDEDDLSDLDDVLDEFAAVDISSNKPTPSPSGPGQPSSTTSTTETNAGKSFPEVTGSSQLENNEFANSLQAGMAELLGELESSPEMQKQFEKLVKELGDGVAGIPMVPDLSNGSDAGFGGAPTDPAAASPDTAARAEASFQETIRATMERMSASNTSATQQATQAAPSTGNAEDDFLAAMLREMEASGAGAGGVGGGGDEDFSKMLLGMMEQLTNKEILYEPMKELHDKFPDWLLVNREKIKKEDLERYEEQQRLVGQIVGKFEERGYADDKPDYREFIVDKMQKMQAAGSPPPDLVGDMDTAHEALGDVDSGCAQQ